MKSSVVSPLGSPSKGKIATFLLSKNCFLRKPLPLHWGAFTVKEQPPAKIAKQNNPRKRRRKGNDLIPSITNQNLITLREQINRNQKGGMKKGLSSSKRKEAGSFSQRSRTEFDYFPFIFVIVLAKASPFRSMAYSTVSFEPVEDVLKSVS